MQYAEALPLFPLCGALERPSDEDSEAEQARAGHCHTVPALQGSLPILRVRLDLWLEHEALKFRAWCLGNKCPCARTHFLMKTL